jgi:redox-sensitive bicupin YhaK (pirin superfamily)
MSIVDLTIIPKEKDLGEFTVRRALPDSRRKLVGPFIFFDHMGPATFEPGNGVNVRAHPHIGIATITYLFEGTIRHRDSLGYDQEITPGAVNWMTAGRGIVHSERTPPALKASGSPLHGIQSWVALPTGSEELEPSFEHYPAGDIPAVGRDGAAIRVILGEAFGVRSPVRTASETLYAELRLDEAAVVDIESDAAEKAVYVVSGKIAVRGEPDPSNEGTLIVFRANAAPVITAIEDSVVMLLGGAPIDGRRTIWWNFVSSSRERIEQAKADWRDGRFDMIDGESEFIPLPED